MQNNLWLTGSELQEVGPTRRLCQQEVLQTVGEKTVNRLGGVLGWHKVNNKKVVQLKESQQEVVMYNLFQIGHKSTGSVTTYLNSPKEKEKNLEACCCGTAGSGHTHSPVYNVRSCAPKAIHQLAHSCIPANYIRPAVTFLSV